MKDKKLIAMFITSIVAFVASLTISLGVAFALADPVAAVGLAEISYNVSSERYTSQEIVFDPVSSYNGDIADAIFVHSYEDIQYANELLPDNIKLVKATVTNDTSARASIEFQIKLTGTTNATKYVKYAIFDADTTEVLTGYTVVDGVVYFNQDIVAPNTTGHYIIAAYVSDELAFEVVNFGSAMTMQIGVYKY